MAWLPGWPGSPARACTDGRRYGVACAATFDSVPRRSRTCVPRRTSYVEVSGVVADETTTDAVRACAPTVAATTVPAWLTCTGASVIGSRVGECQVRR